MPIQRIYPTSRFKKAFRRLPREIQERAVERENLFRADPFDSRLDTHKTKGKLKGLWSYSVDFRYRVLFRFIDPTAVIYYDIGDHSIYPVRSDRSGFQAGDEGANPRAQEMPRLSGRGSNGVYR